jgi:hypothetical protein
VRAFELACGVIWAYDIFHAEVGSGATIDQVELVLAGLLQPFLASGQLEEDAGQ